MFWYIHAKDSWPYKEDKNDPDKQKHQYIQEQLVLHNSDHKRETLDCEFNVNITAGSSFCMKYQSVCASDRHVSFS